MSLTLEKLVKAKALLDKPVGRRVMRLTPQRRAVLRMLNGLKLTNADHRILNRLVDDTIFSRR